uniref:NADH dehydrogenase [ubiquinone] 1 alpha subcomplex subunit 11 n=1 Tax=Rousettus aegyptiacus TaxID=9407 RepID=A0A7J8BTT6_ROUAE|nr:NADH:ubiquinone oxidoreductase subunit A11 [Rousettus aegyptiacus]
MVQKLLHRYWDIPDGTECHRKTYASTSISGAVAHSYGIGAAACVYMGVTAALVKMGQLEGWKVFAEPKV